MTKKITKKPAAVKARSPQKKTSSAPITKQENVLVKSDSVKSDSVKTDSVKSESVKNAAVAKKPVQKPAQPVLTKSVVKPAVITAEKTAQPTQTSRTPTQNPTIPSTTNQTNQSSPRNATAESDNVSPAKAQTAAATIHSNPQTNQINQPNHNQKPTTERTETMTKTEKKTANSPYNLDAMIVQVQDSYDAMQERTELAYEESMKFIGQFYAFNKDNFAAAMESGKIASKGVQELGQDYVETSRKTMKAMTDHVQQLATTNSVVDFLGAQSNFARQGFDDWMTKLAQNSETWLKLAGDVAQPLSNRTAVVADAVKQSI